MATEETAPTTDDYLFRMAMCVVGSLDLNIPSQSYVNLKDTINHANLEALVSAVDPKGGAIDANYIKTAVNNEAKAKDWYVRQISSDDGKDTALILKCDDEVAVYFPGTVLSNLTTLKADIDAVNMEFTTSGGTKCNVDRGFLLRTQNINDKIEKELERLNPTDVSINGYSLGSGMAMLFALGLEDGLKQKVQKVCTFATPHIGDHNLGQAVEKELADGIVPAGKVFNVRNFEDPITYVPPWFVKSPGYDISIDGDGKNGPTVRGEMPEAIWQFIEDFNIEHHMPMAYFNGINALQQKAPSQLTSPSAEQLRTHSGRSVLQH